MFRDSDDYTFGSIEARLSAVEKRCDIKELKIETLVAFKNRAVAYITVLVFIGQQILDYVKDRI